MVLLGISFLIYILINLLTPNGGHIVYIHTDYQLDELKGVMQTKRDLDINRVEELRKQLIEATSLQQGIASQLISVFPLKYEVRINNQSFFLVFNQSGEKKIYHAVTQCLQESREHLEYEYNSTIFQKSGVLSKSDGGIIYKLTAFLNGCAPLSDKNNKKIIIPPEHSFAIHEAYNIDLKMTSKSKLIIGIFSVFLFRFILQTLIMYHDFITRGVYKKGFEI